MLFKMYKKLKAAATIRRCEEAFVKVNQAERTINFFCEQCKQYPTKIMAQCLAEYSIPQRQIEAIRKKMYTRLKEVEHYCDQNVASTPKLRKKTLNLLQKIAD